MLDYLRREYPILHEDLQELLNAPRGSGFSTFAGFTVDFAFEGAEFSIPGNSSIMLSEVFDNLKMPLFVEDVASVTFTDYNLVTVEKQSDGDWLLTSLVAFQTDEKLTVTMMTGEVYVIDVTDETRPKMTIGTGTDNKDGGEPGSVEWYLKDSGDVFIARGTSSNSSTFTLDGSSYAIYGNLADFAADDVYANGEYTLLTIPKVADMHLADYEFNPEAWFEDYPANDSAYTDHECRQCHSVGRW